MKEYMLACAVGKFVVLEPVEKSSVLKAEEISTIFKVISVGEGCEYGSLESGVSVIVEPQVISKTKMGHKDVCYVRETDIVAIVVSS